MSITFDHPFTYRLRGPRTVNGGIADRGDSPSSLVRARSTNPRARGDASFDVAVGSSGVNEVPCQPVSMAPPVDARHVLSAAVDNSQTEKDYIDKTRQVMHTIPEIPASSIGVCRRSKPQTIPATGPRKRKLSSLYKALNFTCLRAESPSAPPSVHGQLHYSRGCRGHSGVSCCSDGECVITSSSAWTAPAATDPCSTPAAATGAQSANHRHHNNQS